MMVGSSLNSNIAAHLLPFTDRGGDLDGGRPFKVSLVDILALLVDDKSQLFEGGFYWSSAKNEDFGYAYFPKSVLQNGGIGVSKR